MSINAEWNDGRPFSDMNPRPRKKQPEGSRFEAFNPEERSILQVLLQNHANTVSEIVRVVENWEGPQDVYAYLARIEALENEVKRVR